MNIYCKDCVHYKNNGEYGDSCEHSSNITTVLETNLQPYKYPDKTIRVTMNPPRILNEHRDCKNFNSR